MDAAAAADDDDDDDDDADDDESDDADFGLPCTVFRTSNGAVGVDDNAADAAAADNDDEDTTDDNDDAAANGVALEPFCSASCSGGMTMLMPSSCGSSCRGLVSARAIARFTYWLLVVLILRMYGFDTGGLCCRSLRWLGFLF